MKIFIPMLAVLALAACATNRLSDTDRLAIYEAHAGEPVNQIRYITPMGWDRIDSAHIVLNMRPKENWLLTLPGNCLDWGNGAPFLTVNSQTGWLITKFDSVKVAGSPVDCRIDEIRPVDIKAVRAAENAKRGQVVSGT